MSQPFASGGKSIGASASASVLPINRLISFRNDFFDLAVQGNLKSLLQHHSSKASIFQGSAFFTIQLSHPYMTTGKTIALTRRTFVGKVMFLLLNMLSRFREMQIKTTVRYHLTLLSKSLQTINAGEGAEKREPSYTAGRNAN